MDARALHNAAFQAAAGGDHMQNMLMVQQGYGQSPRHRLSLETCRLIARLRPNETVLVSHRDCADLADDLGSLAQWDGNALVVYAYRQTIDAPLANTRALFSASWDVKDGEFSIAEKGK